MDTLLQEREQLDQERLTLLAKTETPDFTEADATRANEVIMRMGEITNIVEKRDNASKALRAAGLGQPVADKTQDDEVIKRFIGGLGERFVQSDAYKAFMEQNPLGRDGKPVAIKSDLLGGWVAKAEDDPDPLSTAAGGAIVYDRMQGIVDLTYGKKPKLLDFITKGKTKSSYLEYRQLLQVAAAAAVVKEGETKPLSELTTGTANAAAHVVADGIKVTNQELADDGVLVALLNSILARNLWNKLEDLVLNGTGTNEPRGILNTTGVLNQAFDTNIVKTIRRAITHLEDTSNTEASLVLLNPRDAEELDLLQDDQGRYYSNGPFGSGPSTIWGIPRATSSKITRGTALLGDLASVHLLERDGLKIEAFNQNEDDARNNLTYIRAEARELLLIREPARLLVATIAE
ncbi:phage major capsid protein [Jonesiaceae bacterium BS-20]|uniref:Phage major capsid protein n=1 Tax=Jonesiaceae bacterium BS-20 TaxID=3120821 RepID=A0AAU7DWG7_9MICO